MLHTYHDDSYRKYMHSFKVGTVGDEELVDVSHVKFTPFKLGAQAKRSASPKESESLTL